MKDLSEIMVENINLAITKRGINQLQLALATGISKSKMSKALRGESTFDSLEIFNISKFFKIEVSWFYTEHLEELTQAA